MLQIGSLGINRLKILLVVVSVALLSGCVSTEGELNFERMSKEELAAYNQTQPVSQMIVCGDDERNFSRVRRRICMTVDAMYGSVDQASQLGVLANVPGYAQ